VGTVIADIWAGGGWGGGIAAWHSSFRIQNNIITRNASSNSAGGVGVMYSHSISTEQVIVNNTLFDNHSVYGGGIDVRGSGTAVLALNNILWGDTAQFGMEIYVDAGAAAEVHHCDIQGGWPSGEGNINNDPLFVPGDPAFTLTAESPCIGRGMDSIWIGGVWYHAPAYDFDGDPRPRPVGPQGSDMGAQEEQPTLDVAESHGIPSTFALEQNYPNPFNPTTLIAYQVPVVSEVKLAVYDLLGREVKMLAVGTTAPGRHTVEFDASGLASGVYMYRLRAGDFTQAKRLMVLK